MTSHLLMVLMIGSSLQLSYTQQQECSQLSYSPQQLRDLFKEKFAVYRELGVLPQNGIWNKFEKLQHFKEFSRVAEEVRKHNANPGRKWLAILNQFSLMTPAERNTYLGVKNVTETPQEREESIVKRSNPEDELTFEDEVSVDWSHKLPTAKGQLSCGSCWVFSGVAPLEYQINKDKEDITSLSEQQFLDCVYEGQRDGCGGGWPDQCWQWLERNNNNIASGAAYPYIGIDGVCKTDTKSAMGDYKVFGWTWLPAGNDAMKRVVANPKYGVVAALVMIQGDFWWYGGGLYWDENCYSYNHGVDLVGYGVQDDGEKYWKVRNSWGSGWGEDGYIRMKRGRGIDTCSITSHGHIPYVATDAERTTWFNNNEVGKECMNPDDTHGVLYRGKVNQTKSGLVCQNWLSQSPNVHTTTPDNKDFFNRGLGDHNYCRSPDDTSQPWCYNGEGTDPVWEHCDISYCTCGLSAVTQGTRTFEKSHAMELCEKDGVCSGITCDGDKLCWMNRKSADESNLVVGVYVKDEESCLSDEQDDEADSETCYGEWEITVQGTNVYDSKEEAMYQCEMKWDCKGITCQSGTNCWLNIDSDSEFHKEFTVYSKTCGNEPESNNDDPSIYWDHTIKKECREEWDTTGYSYRGTQNRTKSGIVCQKWTSQTPFPHTRTPELNVGKGLGDHNYCRNPDGESGPWCYNGENYSFRFEVCDIPVCTVCEWETAVSGEMEYSRGEAIAECVERDDCKAFTCRGDEDCWLNFTDEGQSEKIQAVYSKTKSCHEF